MQISLRLHSITHCSKCYIMASGNIGLIQPYMFELETDLEEEVEEWII